jgi:hypothetical protein
MRIQFKTLTFYSRLEEELQEHLCLKESASSLPTTIGAFGSPLGPHPKSDLATDLYSDSTLIANMDESDHQIIVNRFKESATSLSMAIRALSSPLGLHPESDLPTNLYSDSTPIVIVDESSRRISFNYLNKSTISLSAAFGASGSPL